MLEIKNLEVSYKKDYKKKIVIQDFNLTLESGKILAIMGKSGCGKSTLLHTIAGVLKFKGDILVDGKKLSAKNTKIGLIPQDYGLLPWQTVFKNCLFGVGYKDKEMENEARKMLDRLGILELSNQYPNEISGGQAQRVALCRALLLKPQILLMDEPFSALDEVASIEAQKLTAKMWNETKSTGIIITHRLEEALYLADDIAIMANNSKGTIKHKFLNQWKGKLDVTNQEYLEFKNQIEHILMECNE